MNISTLKRKLKNQFASDFLAQGTEEIQLSFKFEEKKIMINLTSILKGLLIASGASVMFAGSAYATGYPVVDIDAVAGALHATQSVTSAHTPANTCIYKNSIYSLGAVVKMVGNDLYVCAKGQTIYVNAKKVSNNMDALPEWISQSKQTLYFNGEGDYSYYLKNGRTVAQAAIKFKGIDDNGTVEKPS